MCDENATSRVQREAMLEMYSGYLGMSVCGAAD